MPYAHNGDVDLYYETFGSPADPALLLVNGLGSQCINYRSEWCEKFAAEGFFVHVYVDRASHRPQPLHAQLRTTLERDLVAAGAG